MNWLLIVVIVLLIGYAVSGIKRGFIKTIFSLASIIVALILTILLSPTVNDMLTKNEKIYGKISENVEKVFALKEAEVEDTDQEDLINDLPLPASIKETLIENKNKGIENINEYIVDYMTGIIINALAFILTFIVIRILLWAISLALDLISKLPVLNQINKAAGLAAGILHGLIIVWLLFILLTVFGGSEFGQKAFAMIDDSVILSTIYNNNLLLGFITRATKIFL